MKASRAYIASLGTSGVLIGSFLLLLAIVSAIFAFRGYPGEASNDGLDRLDVRQSRPAAAVSRAARAQAGESESRVRPAAGERAATRGRVRDGRTVSQGVGAGGVEGVRSQGGVAGGDAGDGATPGGGGGDGNRNGLPGVNPGGGGGGLPQAPSVGDVTGGLGDTVGDATDGLGGAVGRTAPQLEAPVEQVGDTVDGVLEQTAPTVDEVVGGVTDQVGGVTDGLNP